MAGLLAQYNVTTPTALPPLVQLRTTVLAEQFALLSAQVKRLAAELNPLVLPTADVQRLLWIPGIGRIVAFTILLEVEGSARFPSARDFVPYCRLVPGAGNAGGKTRHKRTKAGNRYLKLAFSHASRRYRRSCSTTVAGTARHQNIAYPLAPKLSNGAPKLSNGVSAQGRRCWHTTAPYARTALTCPATMRHPSGPSRHTRV